jgi:twinkle protein
MSTLEDKLQRLVVSEKEIKSYFDGRDNDEHLKIKSPIDYIDEVKEYFTGDYHKGTLLPWPSMKHCFRLRPAETTIWSGWSGHGKSLILNQIMMSLLADHKVMIASFEMQPRSTIARSIRQVSGVLQPKAEYIIEFCERAHRKLYLYDQQGVVTPDTVLSVIYYSVEELGCTQIVIDSLMKCGVPEDDFQGQKSFIDKICVASRDLNCHIHVVAHSRKRSNELGNAPQKHDVSGSANITNLADNVFVQFRVDKEGKRQSGKYTDADLDAMPDSILYCVKQRHYEWEGHIPFYYDKDGMRYKDMIL